MPPTPAAPPAHDTRAPDSPSCLVFFCFAWSLYGLAHQLLTYQLWLQFADPAHLALGAATCAAAACGILAPASLGRFTTLLLVWSAYKLYLMPYVPNHVLFTLLANITILVAIGWRTLRPREGKTLAQAAFEDYAPLVRCELLALYFWVVFHKLNVDFFNPEVSCGWSLYFEIRGVVPFMPVFDGLRYLTIYGTLATEALLPILLAARKTRALGVLLGTAFHITLALHPNPYIMSFTTMLFGAYTLFWPEPWIRATMGAWRNSSMGSLMAHRGLLVLLAAAGLFSMVVLVMAAVDGGINETSVIDVLSRVAPVTVWLIGLIYCAIALTWVSTRLLRQPMPGEPLLLQMRRTPAAVLVIIVALNGLPPYLGIRDQSSLAMFSNLRTSGGSTNHLFMPVSIRLSDRQDDIVVLGESNDDNLSDFREAGYDMTWFEFRRHLAKQGCGFTVTYTRNGVTETLSLPIDANHEAFVPPPWWLRKLLWVNLVAPRDKPCRCRR